MKTKIKNSNSFASGSIFSQDQWKTIGSYEGKPIWWVGLEEADEIAIVVVGQLLNEVKANYLYELMKFSPSSVEITDNNFKYS